MSALPLWAEWAIGLLAVIGGGFALVGAIGLVKLRECYRVIACQAGSPVSSCGCDPASRRGSRGVPE